MALVEDFYVGNTRIQIYDDSCVSKEESEIIRQRIEDRVNGWLRDGSLNLD